MNNYSAIVTDIKTKLLGVTGTGNVYPYFRYSKDASTFMQLFMVDSDAGKKDIRGWEITRSKVTETLKGLYFRHHTMKLNGYLGLQDEAQSDTTFQQFIEEICNVFRKAEAPAEATWFYGNGERPVDSPAQADVIDVRLYGSYLCHHAEITLMVTERII